MSADKRLDAIEKRMYRQEGTGLVMILWGAILLILGSAVAENPINICSILGAVQHFLGMWVGADHERFGWLFKGK